MNVRTFKLIDEILTKGLDDRKYSLRSVSEYPVLKQLFMNSRERAIAVTLLTLKNSATSVRLNLNKREDVITRTKDMLKVMEICEILDS